MNVILVDVVSVFTFQFSRQKQGRDVYLHKPTSKRESNLISYIEAGMI